MAAFLKPLPDSNATSAKALVATFGIPNLAGADLGEATVKVKP